MGNWTELESGDGHRYAAWVAEPAGTPRAGLVVVQEIFGVNVHIRGVAERYAAEGYLAIAPCLFDRVERGVELGYGEAGVARGRELAAALGFDPALRDIAAAANWAAKAGPVSVLGYCWGGTLALLACTRLKLPAVSYYGGRSVPFLHERPGAPLLMHFGERDPIIPPAHVALTRVALPQAEIHVWPAGHGFNCEERADYDPACALQALARTLEFLQRQAA
jgi:carboxymethylenebutenolidase